MKGKVLTELKDTQSGSMDELLGINTETWPKHAGMELGKAKLSWAWI